MSLSWSGVRLSFIGRKGNKQTLRAQDDSTVVDDSVLERALHGISRETFATMFGISHEVLVEGGRALAQGKGEIGQLLFASAAGLTGLQSNRAIHVAIGVNVQNRGVKDILIACVDGLKRFPDAIEAMFPRTQVQLCINLEMTRRTLLQAAAAPLLAKTHKPNVVFFMTDDHGAWSLGSYGCGEMHTPNLDSLAAGGVRFTKAFACTPVCSPSRMTYMTGLIPSLHGVQDYLVAEESAGPDAPRFLDGFVTYSELLRRAGYTLGMCGKWHMGGDASAQAGFSYWCTVPGGGGPYRDPVFVVNGKRAKITGFKDDIVTEHALEFLNRNHDRPFFLQVPFYSPHTPYDYQPEAYRQWYAGSRFPCFPSEPVSPIQNPELRGMHGNPQAKLGYSALVSGVDANVGRVLRRLEELGLRENTLVVFTADQGWNAGHHGVWGKGNGTVPFNMYEEALQVPLIWNFPGRIEPGRTVSAMVSSYDFFPTILDYLGVAAPKDSRRPGRSYAPFMRGESPRWRNRLFFEYAYVRGIRTENLKYIERTNEWPSEFYDLEADPGERRNAINDPVHRAEVSALRSELSRFFQQQGAPPIEGWHSTTKQRLHEYPMPGRAQAAQ